MHEIIAECCDLFSQRFPICLEFALYDEYKRKYSATEVENHLPQSPRHKFPLKDGWLYKRGDNVKNWKRRHFTLLNEADNFEIQYHKIKGESKILMGKISCSSSSYHVETFSVEDTESYGPFGLKLVPYNESHRCWYFIAENEQNMKEWEEVLSYACRKARPYSHHVPIISQAFKNTYEIVRHSYGYFNHVELYGTEEEMLSDLIAQVLHRELLEDAISSLKPKHGKNDVVKKIKEVATRQVSRMSAKTWKKSVEQVHPIVKNVCCDSGEIVFDDETCERFRAISDLEENVRVKLSAAVSSIVDPVLIDVATTSCAPLLENIMLPICSAFSESVKGFEVDMQSVFVTKREGLADIKAFFCELDSAHRRVNHLSGHYETSRNILWDMYTSSCSDMVCSTTCGLDAYDLYCEMSDSIRSLVHDAIHQFGTMVIQGGNFDEKSVVDSLKNVSDMMLSDSKVRQRNDVSLLLNRLIEPMVQEMIIIPSSEVMLQFKDDIQADGLNLNVEDVIQTCGERIIESMISNFLKSLVNEFLPG